MSRFPSIHEETYDKKKAPFFASVFTVSSHEPFNIQSNTKIGFMKAESRCTNVNTSFFHKTLFFDEAKKNLGLIIPFCFL
jgi:phosphoglycerol transferase MdoB-like AlkP superfamily enzyme